jgi:hypothetical protein
MCWKRWIASCVWFLSVATTLMVQAQEKQDQEKPEPPKLTLAEQKFVTQLEKLLITKLAGKSNPSDQYTWYVLMFVDQAEATTVTSSGTTTRRIGGKRTTVPLTKTSVDVATARAAMLVQGRRNAALKVGQYLVSQNAAAGALAEAKGKSATDGARNWDYRAFFVEDEAKAFYESIKPKSAEAAK